MRKLILETSYRVRDDKTVTAYYSWPLANEKRTRVAFATALGHMAGEEHLRDFNCKLRIEGS